MAIPFERRSAFPSHSSSFIGKIERLKGRSGQGLDILATGWIRLRLIVRLSAHDEVYPTKL
ncbi:MAG: hypothetical protein HZA47_02820 [Planctomycetes bacterium]|nr:hypothetical protein [Planctomycetota bacterium]MBI5795233.1 hypothetical protein [Planctomycetota bacterium]